MDISKRLRVWPLRSTRRPYTGEACGYQLNVDGSSVCVWRLATLDLLWSALGTAVVNYGQVVIALDITWARVVANAVGTPTPSTSSECFQLVDAL